MTAVTWACLPIGPAGLRGSCLYLCSSLADLPTLEYTTVLVQPHLLRGGLAGPGRRCQWLNLQGRVDGDAPAVPWGRGGPPAPCLSHLSSQLRGAWSDAEQRLSKRL